jgi:hypothetical protein
LARRARAVAGVDGDGIARVHVPVVRQSSRSLSSTTSPSTADAIIAVPVLSSMPATPMRPPVQRIGITFGMSARIVNVTERKSSPIASTTRTIAVPKLVTCWCTSRVESCTTW